MSKIKKLAGQTVIYGASTILGRLLNYLLVPLHTYIFAPANYGIVAEIYAYITFLNIVYLLGMETAFFHFSNKLEDGKKVFSTAFTSLFGTSVIFSGFILFFYKDIATLLEFGENPEYIAMVAGILAFDTLAAIPFASLRLQEKARKFSFVKIANIGINIFFNVFWLLFCPWVVKQDFLSLLRPVIQTVYDPSIGVGYVFLANLLASGLTLLLLYKEILQFRLRITWVTLKRMLAYSAPLIVVGLAGMINETIDRILLKYLLPHSMEGNRTLIGIYSACYKLSIFMTLVVQAFRYAAEPFFFSEARDNEKPELIYAQVMNYFVFLGGFIFLAVTGYLDILKYIIDQEYHAGLHVVPILLIANLFLGMYFNLSVWYKLTEKNYLGAIISVTGALVTIGLNVWLIPSIEYTGSAIATLASYFSMVALSYGLSRKYYPIPYNIPKLIFYIVLAVVFYGIGWFLEEKIIGTWNGWTLIFNTLLLGVYALIFIYRENVNFLLNLLHNIKNRLNL